MIAVTIPGLDIISKGFAYALWAFMYITGNFGLAIILLTIAMRAVLLPLSIKQTKSMIAMQRLQPQLKEIQKKYKDDREKMGQEMMKLYKENKVSPLGGCLPLLLQLPIIFAVFDVLHNPKKYESIIGKISVQQYTLLGVNVSKTGSYLWTTSHQYWQFIVLILFTIITGYISAKQMTTDPKQAKMMAMMPVLMGVFAWILPVGVTIYIIVTNILTIIQQWVQLEREGFYDERRAQWDKAGEPTKMLPRLKFKSSLYSNKVLIALKLKQPPPPPKKKPAAAKAKTAKAGGAKPQQQKPAGGQQQKKPAAKKPASPPKEESPEESNEKDEKPEPPKVQEQKSSTKKYPAKKKGPGKK